MQTEQEHSLPIRSSHRAPMTVGRILTRERLRRYLPRDDVRPGQYLAAFKGATAILGVPARVRELIDHLAAYVREDDWAAGTPWAWPSNDELGLVLQLGRTQVKTIIRQARDMGFVNIRESANGRRYGFRDDRGHIVEAYGFDLSPLAARFDEFRHITDEFRAAKAARRLARLDATAVRNELVETAAAGVVQAPAAADWQRVHDRAYEAWHQTRTLDDPEQLRAIVDEMKRQRDDLLSALADAVKDGETDPLGAAGRPLNTTTNHPLASNEAARSGIGLTADRSNNVGRPPGRPLALGDERSRVSDDAQPDSPVSSIDALRGFPATPELCLALAPALRGYLGRDSGRPTWSTLVDAAFFVRADLGISRSVWEQACTVMGRVPAAVTIAVVACRAGLGEVHTAPGGLFRAMMNQHMDGKLRLDRTLHRLVDTTLKVKGRA